MRYLKWSFWPMIWSLFHGDVFILKSPTIFGDLSMVFPYKRGADVEFDDYMLSASGVP
jgi:hypothetical protein